MRVLATAGLRAALVLLVAGEIALARAQAIKLPETVQTPEVHSAPAGNVPPKRIGDTPVPEPKPAEAAGVADVTKSDGETSPKLIEQKDAVGGESAGGTPVTPLIAPVPEESPLEHDDGDKPETDGPAVVTQPAAPPDPRSAAVRATLMPPSEISCRQRLRTLGVAFEERPAESDPAGCAIPYPISVGSLGASIALEPAGLMNCAMAEAAARFAKDTMMTVARRELGADLKSISQASTYVCRPRAGTRKLSEHAFGNALDIARFNLSDGKSVDVNLRPDAAAAQFLGAIRKAACGPFKTVLGPGSDADHATHFHLDLAPRRNGGTFCQ